MNIILLLVLVLVLVFYNMLYFTETLLNVSEKLPNETCHQFADRACSQQSYYITNTKTDKFPKDLLPGKPPTTISARCWEENASRCSCQTRPT